MATCYRCGGSYRQVYKDGRLQDLDHGTDLPHWKACKGRGPNRQRVRALRKSTRSGRGSSSTGDTSGRPLERGDVEPFERASRNHHASEPITGPDYKPACAHCEALPWEHCQCWPDGVVADHTNAEADEGPQLALWEEAA